VLDRHRALVIGEGLRPLPFQGATMDLKNVIPGRSQRKNRRDIKDVESAIEALMAELKDLRDRVSRIEGKIEHW